MLESDGSIVDIPASPEMSGPSKDRWKVFSWATSRSCALARRVLPMQFIDLFFAYEVHVG
jgi:hypothetical protein